MAENIRFQIENGYKLKEIAGCLSIHYTTVCKAIKEEEVKTDFSRPDPQCCLLPISLGASFYLRWSTVEREHLFGQLYYVMVSNLISQYSVIPKITSETEVNILENIGKGNVKRVRDLKQPFLATLYFHDSGESYWTKTLLDKPRAYRNGKLVEPSQWFNFNISTNYKHLLYLVLNSNLLYWLWTVYTDCRHMTKGFIESIFLPETKDLDQKIVEQLKQAYSENTILSEKRPGYKSPEIKVQNFKQLINKIDTILAKHYGFTDEELDFIINYDIKYRMGIDN